MVEGGLRLRSKVLREYSHVLNQLVEHLEKWPALQRRDPA